MDAQAAQAAKTILKQISKLDRNEIKRFMNQFPLPVTPRDIESIKMEIEEIDKLKSRKMKIATPHNIDRFKSKKNILTFNVYYIVLIKILQCYFNVPEDPKELQILKVFVSTMYGAESGECKEICKSFANYINDATFDESGEFKANKEVFCEAPMPW
ncbi:hypothetical protein C1645_736346 [Glomus cerebriforme]|uniref:Uncharacterized protein n=1 Tax=Glomus cerebriforme TaxID=658196 RepID=A0A397T1U5_9GLOM|nr:hypothetical protein C1645_736346 [Glomus cerebriforme]